MTARVITVLNQKGGAGKTQVTMQLAGTLALRGERVLVIDTDGQGTASVWARAASDEAPFPATVVELSHAGGTVHRGIREHLPNYDFIVVDCPPSAMAASTSSALLVSDVALVPFQPAPADAWALEAAKRTVETAQATNDALVARLVPNAVKRTTLAQAVLEQLREEGGLPLTTAQLGDRDAYRSCQLMGATVHAFARDKKAIAEVEALADEVLALLPGAAPPRAPARVKGASRGKRAAA